MAKSPWKLLTGLFRRSSDAGVPDSAGLAKTLDEVGAPDATLALPAPDQPEEVDNAPVAETATAAAIETDAAETADPGSALRADDALPEVKSETAATSAVNASIPPKAGKRGGRQPKSKSLARSDIAVHAPAPVDGTNTATAVSAPAAASLPETDPVRLLDDEIRQLRLELSTKLRTQNEQLRQMLKRFKVN